SWKLHIFYSTIEFSQNVASYEVGLCRVRPSDIATVTPDGGNDFLDIGKFSRRRRSIVAPVFDRPGDDILLHTFIVQYGQFPDFFTDGDHIAQGACQMRLENDRTDMIRHVTIGQ